MAAMTSWQLSAQQPTGQRAVEQISQALVDADRQMKCSPLAAKASAQKALDLSKAARDTDQNVTAALGKFIADSNDTIRKAEDRRAELETAAKDASSAIKQARLRTAASTLSQSDPDGCYENSQKVRREILEREARADGLIRQANEALSKHPKEAIRILETVATVNSEIPDLPAKLAQAKEAERLRPKAHIARNAVVSIIVLGGITYGLIYAGQHQKK